MDFSICEWAPDITDELLASWRADGVTCLEPGAPFLMDQDQWSLETATRALRDAGIDIYACHAPFGADNELCSMDESRRNIAVANHILALEQAARADATVMVIHASSRIDPAEERLRRGQLYASIKRLLKEAESLKVCLGLENLLPGMLGDDATVLRRIVDDFDSPWLGICFDTGHAHLTATGLLNTFEILSDRIVTFHIQDNDAHYDSHVQPPYGTIDWADFVHAFTNLPFNQPLSVETHPWKRAPWRVLLREMKALFSTGPLTVNHEGKTVRVTCTTCGHLCFGTPDNWFCACSLL